MSIGFGLTNGEYTIFINGYDASGTSLSGWVRKDFTIDLPNATLPEIAVNPGDGRIAVQWPDDPSTVWV